MSHQRRRRTANRSSSKSVVVVRSSVMAAVQGLRAMVKSDSGSDRSDSESDSESDRGTREAEPMEVEEGELEAEDISVNRSLKELLPDTSRRYVNKAGAFITGIDLNSKVAIMRKEERARRFNFRGEVSATQRNIFLDKDAVKKAIPKIRMEAVHVTGVDDMSTQDIFGYFKEYPPAHIEWIDDTSCNVVWLDDNTAIRAFINTSQMPEPHTVATDTGSVHQMGKPSKGCRSQGSDDDVDNDDEEGEVDDVGKKSSVESPKDSDGKAADTMKVEAAQGDDLSQAERESLLRNDPRPAIKPFKGNQILLRFATEDDKKELGAARRSRYYMKYGNPNYGGMKGILSNSWKRRFHSRRIQRDVIKSKKPLIGDSMGHTPPYTHRHSADLVNLPEEPIKEEEEEEEEEDYGDEDMDSDDRVVEFKEKGDKGAVSSRPPPMGPRSRGERSPSPWSESDEMDYDLELKMISTPSPKKSKKMTMYADELESQLKSIRNRVGESASQSRAKSPSPSKVTDVRQLLEEKRQGLSQHRPQTLAVKSGKTDVRQRLGKRRYSPERRHSPSPVSPRDAPHPTREPISDVHRRLGIVSRDRSGASKSSKDRKTSWKSRTYWIHWSCKALDFPFKDTAEILSEIKALQLSRSTVTRHCDSLAEDLTQQMWKDIRDCECFSLQFWTLLTDLKYHNMRKCGTFWTVLFGAICLCEFAFSHMKIIKSKYCSTLTDEHLEVGWRLVVSRYYELLADSLQCKSLD